MKDDKTLAYELLQDMKKQNKRMFIIILVTLGMFTGLLSYTIWLLNDIGVETTEVSQDTNNGNNNFIGNDGDITNGKTDN